MNATANMMLFSGNANSRLAAEIAEHLGKPLGEACISRFDDGEVRVELQESVRGKDVFIIQSTCFPVNDHLMELMALADALCRASVNSITAVISYFGYARQDRRVQSARVPIMAKVVADMIRGVGINRVLTVDLYTDQIQGFFDIPVDAIYTTSVFIKDLRTQPNHSSTVIVAPDIGGVTRARAVANVLNAAEFAIIDKQRTQLHPTHDLSIIGTVAGKHCVIIDDAVETANTLGFAAQVLKQKGAASVSAYCTHPLLSESAVERIQASLIDEVVVTDTIPLCQAARDCKKLRVLSLSGLLAETIHHVYCEESISPLFLN